MGRTHASDLVMRVPRLVLVPNSEAAGRIPVCTCSRRKAYLEAMALAFPIIVDEISVQMDSNFWKFL